MTGVIGHPANTLQDARVSYDLAYDAANVLVDRAWARYQEASNSDKARTYRAYESALDQRRAVIARWDAEIERLGGIVCEVGR